MVQAVFWFFATAVSFSVAVYMINTSLQEARASPLVTTVNSISVKDVPFPAITIDAGKYQNHWGIVEKLFRFVDFECYDSPYDCPADKEAPLSDFRFYVEEVARRFFDVGYASFMRMSLEEVEEWHDYNYEPSVVLFPRFDRAVATLALILVQDRSRGAGIREKLLQATVPLFSRFSVSRRDKYYLQVRRFGSKVFLPIVEEEAALVNVSRADAYKCMGDRSSCSGTYQEAYATMLLPFTVLRSPPAGQIPYDGLSLGEFISFFASSVLTVPLAGYAYSYNFPFLSSGSREVQMKLHDYMLGLSGQLGTSSNASLQNMTTYELSTLADHSPFDVEVLPVLEESGCGNIALGLLWDIWNTYMIANSFGRNFGNGQPSYYSQPFEVKQPPCVNETFDALTGASVCCRVIGSWKQQHALILSLLKYNVQPPHFDQMEDELESDLTLAKKAFKRYRFKSMKDVPVWNTNPRIFSCQHNDLDHPLSFTDAARCHLFVRSYTTLGLGYSFNTGEFWSRHLESNQFNNIFHDIMHPKLPKGGKKVYYSRSTGSKYGLTASIQKNKYQPCESCMESTHKVQIAIHDPSVPADLRGMDIEAESGYLTTFVITPNKVTTSMAAKKLDIESRGCRFDFEHEGLEIFSSYSQKACEFECLLKVAHHECMCIPWNYPKTNLSADLCDFIGSRCFETVT